MTLLTRVDLAHKPAWQRFQTDLIPTTLTVQQSDASSAQHVYQRQYAHVYHARLSVLGPRCVAALEEQKDDATATRVSRILDLKEGAHQVAVGTLVCEAAMVAEKKNSDDDDDLLHPDSFCRKSDQFYLEDASGRVALEESTKDSGLLLHSYCTGAVVAVQGTVRVDGVWQVERITCPAPPKPLAAPPPPSTKSGSHVLLVSGLHCGSPHASSLPRSMLLHFLQGRLGKSSLAASIGHVIVAGGLVAGTTTTVDALKELDGFLSEAAVSGVPVDVVPGQADPTTANWPQRPLHKALLPQSSGLVHRTPNPYQAAIGERRLVGTDGLNVRDLQKRVLVQEENGDHAVPPTECQALARLLAWSHVCPTGPSTVPTMPHKDKDPMVLETWPDVLFCGGSTSFDTALVGNSDQQKVRLICVPDFSTTGQAVLLDTGTLEVQVVRFQA